MSTIPVRALLASALACACPSASATDFWIIFDRGETPVRELFYAASTQAGAARDDSPRATQIVQVLEAPGLPAAIAYQVQVQCSSQRLKVLSASARLPSDSEVDLAIGTDWAPASAGWMQRTLRFTCQPQGRETDGMRQLGDTPPQDLVLFTNQDLWGAKRKTDSAARDVAITQAGSEAVRRELEGSAR